MCQPITRQTLRFLTGCKPAPATALCVLNGADDGEGLDDCTLPLCDRAEAREIVCERSESAGFERRTEQPDLVGRERQRGLRPLRKDPDQGTPERRTPDRSGVGVNARVKLPQCSRPRLPCSEIRLRAPPVW